MYFYVRILISILTGVLSIFISMHTLEWQLKWELSKTLMKIKKKDQYKRLSQRQKDCFYLFTHSETHFASVAVVFPTSREGSTLNLRRGRGVLGGLVTSRHGVPSVFGRDEEVFITSTNSGQSECRSHEARAGNRILTYNNNGKKW